MGLNGMEWNVQSLRLPKAKRDPPTCRRCSQERRSEQTEKPLGLVNVQRGMDR